MVWYVAFSAVLYFLYPLIYFNILNKRNSLLYIALLCLFIYVGCYFFKIYDFEWYRSIEIALTRIPVFLIGCYCGILVYENRNMTSFIKIVAFVTVLIGIAYFFKHPFSLFKTFRIPYLFFGPSIVICMAICFECLNSPSLNKYLKYWGDLSLELYLSHIVLKVFFVSTVLYKNSKVMNFLNYIIFILISSYIWSYIVNRFIGKYCEIKILEARK